MAARAPSNNSSASDWARKYLFVKSTVADAICRSVATLKAAGAPVTYLLYPDEGHGFVCAENNLSFYAVAEYF
jgi:hypothetical protein